MGFVWIFLYGLIYIATERVSLLFEASHLIMIFAMSLYWIFFFVCVYKRGELRRYGICRPQHKGMTEYILYAWLLLMPFTNLTIAALSSSAIKINVENLPGILPMIYFGLGEEVLFRGGILSLLTKQYKTNVLKGTLITSLMFSAMHMINIYSSATVGYAVVQSICAAATGFCFGMITCREKSIIPCVMIHSLTNITSLAISNRNIIAGETKRFDLNRLEMTVFLVVAGIYMVYGIWLYKKKSQKITKEKEYESVY